MTLCRESGVSFQREGSPEPVHYDRCPACGAPDIDLIWVEAERWGKGGGTASSLMIVNGVIQPEPKFFSLTIPEHEVPT